MEGAFARIRSRYILGGIKAFNYNGEEAYMGESFFSFPFLLSHFSPSLKEEEEEEEECMYEYIEVRVLVVLYIHSIYNNKTPRSG